MNRPGLLLRLFPACLLLVLAVAVESRAQLNSGLLSGNFRIHDALFPFYAGAEPKLCTVVRVEDIYTDCERRGFFRIGILPLEVMEGVGIEIRNPETAGDGLAQLHHWLESQGARRVELRRVKFLVDSTVTNRVEAGRIRVAADGTWQLLDGVKLVSGTNETKAARATLQISGEQAGELVLETQPPATNFVFGLTATVEKVKTEPTHEK